MITEIYIDGFKSLLDFTISFTKGINAIVGPNGVGKTNICQAMTLLASIPGGSIEETLISYGGAASIFNKHSIKKNTIHIIAKGATDVILKSGKDENSYNLKYEYDVTIKMTHNRIALIENLSILRMDKDEQYIPIINVTNKNNTLKYTILNKELIGDFNISEHKLSLKISKDDNIWGLMPRLSFACHAVSQDIYRIKSINIDPNIAREACDIVEPNRMLSNGRYMANAIYSLSKNKEKFEEINAIIDNALGYDGIIKSEYSPLLLKRYFTLAMNNREKISSNCLSDGTIKLLGLLVGIINHEKFTMIIEEPENYLHPRVDRILMEFLKETFENGVCVITSHSETILNLLSPNELIICDNDHGRTICKRLDNAESIIQSITDSGFGCGYHYVAGNLSNI